MDQLVEALQRAATALCSAMDKVMAADPAWSDLPDLLTEDELTVFLAFTTDRSARWT